MKMRVKLRSAAGAALALAALSVHADLPDRAKWPDEFKRIPALPYQAQPDDLRQGGFYDAEGEPLVYVGTNQNGQGLLFSLIDVPQQSATFPAAVAKCQSKGEGWGVPSYSELMRMSSYERHTYPQFLPGFSWTSTLVNCPDCNQQNNPIVAYDVVSMNRSSYQPFPFFTNFPVCVKRL